MYGDSFDNMCVQICIQYYIPFFSINSPSSVFKCHKEKVNFKYCGGGGLLGSVIDKITL